MELLDASKENIQPLKRGRNMATLNTALQAQTDPEVYLQLMKEREDFEILVRSYSGDDPLKPWYDYVQWVEQNFPKHGREGNLKVLLENCLSEFKDSKLYSQDVRYIDLLTRYMSFVEDPLAMYKQIHALGIGTSCAIFYQCWAEEYEQTGDLKRADQIYIEGIRSNAQPIEELTSAHTAFQIRVARNILGQNPIESGGQLMEERTALSMLRAHGRKRNMVDSTRVGNSIKHSTPGVFRSHANVPLTDRRNGNAQLPKIVVYNDENAPISDAVANSHVKATVSLSQQNINKENTRKPGRWNEGKFKKKSASSIGIIGTPAITRNPTFAVHVDENSDVPRTPKTDIGISNVLTVRKHVYEDEKNIQIALFEPPDPSKIAMYPKNKVYSGGTEFSLEELRALVYFKREKGKKESSREDRHNNIVPLDVQNETHMTDQWVPHHKEVVKPCNLIEHDSKTIESGVQHVCEREVHITKKVIEADQTDVQKCNFNVFIEAEEEMDAMLKQRKPMDSVTQKERKSIPPSAQFPKEIPFSGCLKVTKIIKERKESEIQTDEILQRACSSLEHREADQSLTVHTKAVINDVRGMWVSSPPAKSKHSEASFVSRPSVSYYPNPSGPQSSSSPQICTPFKIFSDISTVECEQTPTNNIVGRGNQTLLPIRTNPDQMDSEVNSWKGKDVGGLCPRINNVGFQTQAASSCVFRDEFSIEEIKFNVYSENAQDLHTNEQEKRGRRRIAKEDSRSSRNERENFETYCPKGGITYTNSQLTQNCTPREGVLVPGDRGFPENPVIISHVKSNEAHNSNTGIPFIPSPGMTQAQLAAIQGTDDKENIHGGKHESKVNRKSCSGILVPSQDVYFMPLDRQHTDSEMEQENAFSDETCCTEAFAIPLVSSTPMVQPLPRGTNMELRRLEETEDTIALMNIVAKGTCVSQDNTTKFPEETSLKIYSGNQDDNKDCYFEVPYPEQVTKGASAQLSTILEISEQKQSTPPGTTDGSYNSKLSVLDTNETNGDYSKRISSASYQNPVLIKELAGLQDEIDLFRNAGSGSKRVVYNNAPWTFFSSKFRDDCLARSAFPTELHQSHCVRMNHPFDTKEAVGTSLTLGRNVYCIFETVFQKKEHQCFIGTEVCSRLSVKLEIKSNASLWEQYLQEEIRLRIADPSEVHHFVTTKNLFIFTDKHVVVSPVLKSRSMKCMLEENVRKSGCGIAEDDFLYIASEMIELVFCLHKCNIVHGNLSIDSFMLLSENPLFLMLSNFEHGVDVTLLPPSTLFDAREKPVYNMLNACQVSPFQIDYLALADTLHQLIFDKSMKVYKESGIWHISTSLSRNFEESVWNIVFRELLNNSEVNLLHLCNLLRQYLKGRRNRTNWDSLS